MAGRARWALIIAAILGVLLVAAAFVPGPFQESSASIEDGVVSYQGGPASLFAVNGWWVVVVLSVPLVVTAVVTALLRAGSVGLGWAATGVLVALCLLGAMSVGLVALPVVVLLLVACASARETRAPQPAI